MFCNILQLANYEAFLHLCRRHSLVFRHKTSIAQKLPKNLEEQIEKFSHSIKELREKTDVPNW